MVRQVQLPCMSEENVEFAFPAPRVWGGWGMDPKSTFSLLNTLLLKDVYGISPSRVSSKQ